MASTSHPSDPPPPEVLPWLKTLPLAPEYHPTLAEFQDPISFILKIEKEASSYGICKIVPPLPPPPKKTSISNLNRSFAARDPGAKRPPTFTTRQQQIGFCPRRPRPVQKPVWQSGERYTLQQFEARAKQFERSLLKKHGRKTPLAPLEMETLFWKACVDRPFSVEYANDMPGSGFAPVAGVGAGGGGGRRWRDEAAGNVGETAWNMRGVSRAKGSLLRFMKEEIAGVTSPMVYVAMMFSWFAWHVEDHDLHSLNYLHLGASKTWYGVPRDARLAFEDVVRVHGYAGEVNPLVTFSILGEKTTVMSPEILVGAGIPCCRLVQNAGEFVVTFPGAYHTGFSHGFNCGEAANIATPEWLRFAKEAAVRRASTNFPPMVSHFQLLYALALSLSSRLPMISSSGPRSSRLKDKMKGEGEVVIKNTFVQSVAQNNRLLNVLLEKGSPCVILPQKALDISFCSGSLVRPQIKVNPRLSLGLCSREEGLEASGILPSHGVRPGRDLDVGQSNCSGSIKGRPIAEFEGKKFASAACSKYGTSDFCSTTSDPQCIEGGRESAIQGDGLFDQGLLSCVTCGILSFACVAVIQPREATAGYLMSADCSFFNDQIVGSGDTSEIANATNMKTDNYDIESCSGSVERHFNVKSDEKFAHHGAYLLHVSDRGVEVISGSAIQNKVSALDLIVSAYGDLSESEDDAVCGNSVCNNGDEIRDSSSSSDQNHRPRMPFTSENICTTKFSHDDSEPELIGLDLKTGAADNCKNLSFVIDNCSELPVQDSGDIVGSDNSNGLTSFSPENKSTLQLELSRWNHPERMGEASPTGSSNDCDTKGITNIGGTGMKMRNPEAIVTEFSEDPYSCHVPAAPTRVTATEMQLGNCSTMIKSSSILSKQRSDKDSSRMHVFCLEHAVEVEKQLRPVGGVHIMLLCHPDYPRIEVEAKLLAEELGSDHSWKDIPFQEATKEDQERIRLAMEDEEAIPTNSDWAVKMGINLYYSANLSKSPLYCKQMPYNSVIYTAFGYKSAGNSPVKPKSAGRRLGRQKKIVVAGKWCGKVWMSNQVHPYLARREDTHEQDHAHKVHSEGTDEKPKIETDTELVRQTTRPKRNSSTTPAARKSGKKRKTTLNKASTKKRRCAPSENSPLEEVKENSSVDCARHLRSSHLKQNSSSCSKISRQHKLNVQDEAGGPSTRLRKRPLKNEAIKTKPRSEKQSRKRKGNKIEEPKAATNKEDELEYPCDMEGCSMSFGTKQDLALHKRNICPVKGCGKKFFSHKYLVQHRKVHLDDRPLKCPWKGCRMSFKWAWARTEHIRVHTGDRPYVCREAGCGQTFRFVSDFSRHKRKTGHSVKKGRR